tara:strand:- start:2474 stop:3034 length:561 start_codon:yes stop_codon:yes gene_type:complete
MNQTIDSFMSQIKDVLSKTASVEISQLERDINTTFFRDGRIFLIGNGGSQAICSHITTDLIKRCNINTHSLNSDSMITCLANDYGFDQMYVEWLKGFNIGYDDMLIAISSSGKSKNILNAIKFADHMGTNISFMHGFNVNEFKSKNPNIAFSSYIFLDSDNYGVVELGTEIILHSIVEKIVNEINK